MLVFVLQHKWLKQLKLKKPSLLSSRRLRPRPLRNISGKIIRCCRALGIFVTYRRPTKTRWISKGVLYPAISSRQEKRKLLKVCKRRRRKLTRYCWRPTPTAKERLSPGTWLRLLRGSTRILNVSHLMRSLKKRSKQQLRSLVTSTCT